jgi:REP element-mobilizing transposase RayT
LARHGHCLTGQRLFAGAGPSSSVLRPARLAVQHRTLDRLLERSTGKTCPQAESFQRGGFHHRLRTDESYAQKWQYVRENPVRADLVEQPEDWPYQGRVHEIM